MSLGSGVCAFRLRYQGEEVFTNSSIKDKLRYWVSEFFPRQMPLNLEKLNKLFTLKLFSVDRYVVVSHIYFSGSVDEFGRPVPDAVGVVLEDGLFDAYGRDIFSIAEYLREFRDREPSELEVGLLTYLEEKSFLLDNDRLGKALKYYSGFLDLYSGIISSMLRGRRVVVVSNPSNIITALSGILLFMPKVLFSRLNISTFCEDLSEEVEDIVFVDRSTWIPASSQVSVFDFASGSMTKVDRLRFIDVFLRELCSDAWYSFSIIEFYRFIMDLLSDYMRRGKLDLNENRKVYMIISTSVSYTHLTLPTTERV